MAAFFPKTGTSECCGCATTTGPCDDCEGECSVKINCATRSGSAEKCGFLGFQTYGDAVPNVYRYQEWYRRTTLSARLIDIGTDPPCGQTILGGLEGTYSYTWEWSKVGDEWDCHETIECSVGIGMTNNYEWSYDCETPALECEDSSSTLCDLDTENPCGFWWQDFFGFVDFTAIQSWWCCALPETTETIPDDTEKRISWDADCTCVDEFGGYDVTANSNGLWTYILSDIWLNSELRAAAILVMEDQPWTADPGCDAYYLLSEDERIAYVQALRFSFTNLGAPPAATVTWDEVFTPSGGGAPTTTPYEGVCGVYYYVNPPTETGVITIENVKCWLSSRFLETHLLFH